ncbi:hypothetical protein JOM56_003260 [Amanita muscaria]
MDPGHSLPSSLQGSPIPTVTHYLPVYEEVNLSYSYRLPTYRSSYMRRYHPYPRYIVSPTDENLDDGLYAHGEAPLHLDISVAPMMLEAAAPAPNVERVEDHLDVHEDPAEKRSEKFTRPSVFVI